MAAIPTYLVEEHHEVFFIWHHAIQNGSLAPAGNLLLHVDEHADIGAPRFHRPLPPLGTDPHEVQRFTYQELACFEFIIPAIYQGIFTELVWIHGRPSRKSDQLVIVRSRDGRGSSFELAGVDLGKKPMPAGDPAPGTAHARYFVRTVEDPLPAAGPIVLDIDLDYFSCEDAVNQVQRVEVTRDEFESFANDRYHFLRITQGSRLRVSHEDGRYYLYLRNYPEPMPTPLRVAEEEILRRLDALMEFLVRNRVRPQLIEIARSRFSGFTPADQWEFIERALLTQLRAIFELDVRTIDETYAALDRQSGQPDRHPHAPVPDPAGTTGAPTAGPLRTSQP